MRKKFVCTKGFLLCEALAALTILSLVLLVITRCQVQVIKQEYASLQRFEALTHASNAMEIFLFENKNYFQTSVKNNFKITCKVTAPYEPIKTGSISVLVDNFRVVVATVSWKSCDGFLQSIQLISGMIIKR